LPLAAQEYLVDHLARPMVDRHTLYAADKLKRGRLEDVIPPLSKLDKALKSMQQSRKGKAEMEGEIDQWRDKVEAAYAAAAQNPQAQSALASVWNPDPYLRYLLTPPVEEADDPQNVARGVLSFIILYGTEPSLSKEMKYLLALYWFDSAGRARNEVERYAAANLKPTQAKVDKAASDAENAIKWAQKYEEEFGLSPNHLAYHLDALEKDRQLAPLDLTLGEELVKDLHRSLALRLEEIDTLALLGRTGDAAARAEELAADVQKLCEDGRVAKFLEKFKTSLREEKGLGDAVREAALKHMDNLKATLENNGSVAWLGHAAAVRAAQYKK
jgi:hypothetical protein